MELQLKILAAIQILLVSVSILHGNDEAEKINFNVSYGVEQMFLDTEFTSNLLLESYADRINKVKSEIPIEISILFDNTTEPVSSQENADRPVTQLPFVQKLFESISPEIKGRVKSLKITGSLLPGLPSLSGFNSLEKLDVSNNKLVGLPDLSNIKTLKILKASNNKLSQNLLLGNLKAIPSLEIVDFSENEFTKIPDTIFDLLDPNSEIIKQNKSFMIINLSGNELDEPEDTSFEGCNIIISQNLEKKLEIALLEKNASQFEEAIKPIISNIVLHANEDTLNIKFSGLPSDNNIRHDILSNFFNSLSDDTRKAVMYLHLENNGLNAIPSLENFIDFLAIHLSNNKISVLDSAFVENLKRFKSLNFLDLETNPLHQLSDYKKQIQEKKDRVRQWIEDTDTFAEELKKFKENAVTKQEGQEQEEEDRPTKRPRLAY